MNLVFKEHPELNGHFWLSCYKTIEITQEVFGDRVKEPIKCPIALGECIRIIPNAYQLSQNDISVFSGTRELFNLLGKHDFDNLVLIALQKTSGENDALVNYS